MSIESKKLRRRASDRWSQRNKNKYIVGKIYPTVRKGKGSRKVLKNNYSKEYAKAIKNAL